MDGGTMVPVVKQKTCESCGKIFLCHQEEGCWCSAVEVDSAVRQRIQSEYRDCICEGCLRAAATRPKLG
ncbi:MAG: hypothetical protein DMG28_18200 [Acidobacteria bacterium]|nr:MAG: hypothetical protein DMG28_18200 [Acidobacteriota bacterium]